MALVSIVIVAVEGHTLAFLPPPEICHGADNNYFFTSSTLDFSILSISTVTSKDSQWIETELAARTRYSPYNIVGFVLKFEISEL